MVDTVLTAEEEAGLELYLLHLAGCGFPSPAPWSRHLPWPQPNTLAEATVSTLNMALDQGFSENRFDEGYSDIAGGSCVTHSFMTKKVHTCILQVGQQQ